jgi:hypothetical protein
MDKGIFRYNPSWSQKLNKNVLALCQAISWIVLPSMLVWSRPSPVIPDQQVPKFTRLPYKIISGQMYQEPW